MKIVHIVLFFITGALVYHIFIWLPCWVSIQVSIRLLNMLCFIVQVKIEQGFLFIEIKFLLFYFNRLIFGDLVVVYMK